jgi:hypothetical protein
MTPATIYLSTLSSAMPVVPVVIEQGNAAERHKLLPRPRRRRWGRRYYRPAVEPGRRDHAGGLSALANFAFLPYYPIWSLLVIALDVFVIWALCLYNRDAASDVAAERRSPAARRRLCPWVSAFPEMRVEWPVSCVSARPRHSPALTGGWVAFRSNDHHRGMTKSRRTSYRRRRIRGG